MHMKNPAYLTLAMAGVAALAFSACATRHDAVGYSEGPGGTAVVTTVDPTQKAVLIQTAPPPPKHEAIPGDASAEQVWVPGFWMNESGHWVWIRGHYETRPAANAKYIPGEWTRTGSGWQWTPGRWQ